MKIGIITLPLHANYGGNLQCYALQTILKQMGHEATNVNIQYPRAHLTLKERPKLYWNRLKNKINGDKIGGIIFYEEKERWFKSVYNKYATRFIKQNITLTDKIYVNKNDFIELASMNFDAFIAGSDQIWRIPYTFPSIKPYFLHFLKNSPIKRFSYAASFGTDEREFSEEQQSACGSLIQQFQAVSVREDSAINMIKNTYQWKCKNPVQVLDPTLLLDKSHYLKLISKHNTTANNGELFYYILDSTPEKQDVIDQISQTMCLKPYTVYSPGFNMTDKKAPKAMPPVEQWLRAFNDARFIVTDSYHGCIFAIIFNKPFLAYGNIERGLTRFKSLLKIFNLENRLITTNNITQESYQAPIDWDFVNQNLVQWRKHSMEFLNKNLNNTE